MIGMHITVCGLHLSVTVRDRVPGSDPAQPGPAGPRVAEQWAARPGPSSTGHGQWVQMGWPFPTRLSRRGWARHLSAAGLAQDCGTAGHEPHAHWPPPPTALAEGPQDPRQGSRASSSPVNQVLFSWNSLAQNLTTSLVKIFNQHKHSQAREEKGQR